MTSLGLRQKLGLGLCLALLLACAEGHMGGKDGGSGGSLDATNPPMGCSADSECDDALECTEDVCNSEAGLCEHRPDDSLCEASELCALERGCELRPPCAGDDDCDDGDFCNGTETCDPATGCQRGEAPVCDDGLGCTVDTCDSEAGACANTPDDALCSNGAVCDGLEACAPEDEAADANGCLAGTPLECDDGVGCTVDGCAEPGGCEYVPDDSSCDDGVFCNGPEVCDPSGGCGPGTAPSCDDGFSCTADSCDTVADECAYAPDDSVCEDSLVCNGDETCQVGVGCVAGTDVVCDDGLACTTDRCVEPSGTCEVLGSDADGDGFTAVGCGSGDDCNDLVMSINPDATEVCDGEDNDCSGGEDDGPGMECVQGSDPVDCTTACSTPGTRTCDSACGLGACVAATETCNGCDDDGDSIADNGLGCVQGSSMGGCTTACGTPGSRACFSDCSGYGSCLASSETCNGCDDDGNGLPDDTLTCARGSSRGCFTGCGTAGTQACALDCSGYDSCVAAEVCNGCDDDGNGVADDGVGACRQDAVVSCVTSCGTAGTRRCANDCSGYSTCAASGEVCGNGCDDDNNGVADDGCGGPHNLCSGAAVLTGATGTRSDPFSGPTRSVTDCGSGGEIWYQITLSSRSVLYVDTFGSTFDTTLSLRTSCAGAAVQCEDDDCGERQEQLVRVLNAGTYYIAVHAFSSSSTSGTVSVRWQTVSAGNGSYTRITANGTYTGTTSGTGTLSSGCGGGGPENGHYFTVCPGLSRTVTANTCTGTSFDTVLSMRAGGDTEVSCNDDSCGLQSSISGAASGPGVYVIQMDGFGSSAGAYQLAVGGL